MEQSVFRINQAGYAAGLPVRAAVLGGGPVTLEDDKGNVIRTIADPQPRPDAASGDNAALLDLGVLPEGAYTLRRGGEQRGFSVSAKAFRAVGNALVKGLYYQRCGCALLPEHAGPYAHAACHTAPAQDWTDRSVRRSVTGGWHDAGDYGKYTGPGAVTAAHLMYAWKLFPDGCGDDLCIPETGNGVPDILNETKYELDWLQKMQRPDGSFHHKLTKDHFAAFIMPEEDREQEYLMPPSHCATGAACACLALASRIYRAFDGGYADGLLESARRAWTWLEKHGDDFVPFRNPEGVRTGPYGDGSDRDERFWAACELFAATGEKTFRTSAEKIFREGLRLTAFGWADVGGLGAVCCLFELKEKAGSILFDELKAAFLRECERILGVTRASGYGTALTVEMYSWGSVLPLMCNAMAMILGAMLTGRQEMRDAALIQMDYALGLNALDKCFITGFGERRVMHPHHRPSGADGIDEPVPGLIAGGPNKRWTYGGTREKLGPDVPAAKYYLDETPSADTNEIAIYWNSPAAFTAAYFNDPASRRL